MAATRWSRGGRVDMGMGMGMGMDVGMDVGTGIYVDVGVGVGMGMGMDIVWPLLTLPGVSRPEGQR